MNFNKHFGLEGRHAFLSASKYHWVNYTEDKIDRVWLSNMAAQRGTDLHKLAHDMIRLRVKLEDKPKTLNMYVNDAIGWGMTPEQMLYYSDNAFGTADAISFKKNILRISDLKTGVNESDVKQLLIYAAFFCLEYGLKPFELEAIELRIYQNDDVALYLGDPVEIALIMDKIVTFDRRIRRLKEEANS